MSILTVSRYGQTDRQTIIVSLSYINRSVLNCGTVDAVQYVLTHLSTSVPLSNAVQCRHQDTYSTARQHTLSSWRVVGLLYDVQR